MEAHQLPKRPIIRAFLQGQLECDVNHVDALSKHRNQIGYAFGNRLQLPTATDDNQQSGINQC